jgi:hypothetical protein
MLVNLLESYDEARTYEHKKMQRISKERISKENMIGSLEIQFLPQSLFTQFLPYQFSVNSPCLCLLSERTGMEHTTKIRLLKLQKTS